MRGRKKKQRNKEGGMERQIEQRPFEIDGKIDREGG
jgi:hypothetical protein